MMNNSNRTWNFLALIDVRTGLPVGHQHVARVALALVAVLGVDAFVAALVVLDACALVNAAV